jgi:HEAT repeat protein
MAALKDRDEEPRLHAVEALGQIGPEAWPAVPALVDLLWQEGHGSQFRAAVVRSLASIGPSAAMAVPYLQTFLKVESDPIVRQAVEAALPALGAPEGEPPARNLQIAVPSSNH